MDDCRYTPISRFGRYSALFFYPVIGIICIAAGIWALIDSVMSGQFGSMTICCMVLVSGISFLMFALSFWFYRFESRKFLVSIEGISVSDKGKSFYRWDEVHGVTISAFAAAASLQNYQTVICVFLKPETETILRKILRSYIYGARHRDQVLIIDYSSAMLDKIASVYPGTILDCRKEQLSHS